MKRLRHNMLALTACYWKSGSGRAGDCILGGRRSKSGKGPRRGGEKIELPVSACRHRSRFRSRAAFWNRQRKRQYPCGLTALRSLLRLRRDRRPPASKPGNTRKRRMRGTTTASRPRSWAVLPPACAIKAKGSAPPCFTMRCGGLRITHWPPRQSSSMRKTRLPPRFTSTTAS